MRYLGRFSAAGLGTVLVVLLTGANASHAAGSAITLSGPSPLAHCPGLPGTITNFTAEPHMAVNPRDRNNIVAAWQQDRSFGARGTVVSYTRDGGHTWRSVIVPGANTCSPGQVAVADPWLTFDGAGTAYLADIAGRPNEEGEVATGVIVNRSEDGGATWSTPSTVTEVDFFDDKPSITADPNRSAVVYATWDRSEDDCDNGLPCPSNIYFSASTDGATTWSEGEPVAPSPRRRQHNARIVVLPNGDLRLSTENTGRASDSPSVVRLRISGDGGGTWERPKTLAQPDGYASMPSIAVNANAA